MIGKCATNIQKESKTTTTKKYRKFPTLPFPKPPPLSLSLPRPASPSIRPSFFGKVSHEAHAQGLELPRCQLGLDPFKRLLCHLQGNLESRALHRLLCLGCRLPALKRNLLLHVLHFNMLDGDQMRDHRLSGFPRLQQQPSTGTKPFERGGGGGGATKEEECCHEKGGNVGAGLGNTRSAIAVGFPDAHDRPLSVLLHNVEYNSGFV